MRQPETNSGNDLYSQRAGIYLSLVDSKPHNALYERPAMIRLIPNVEGQSILDMGCAGGWYSQQLLEKGAHVTALDNSPEMVEAARKILPDHVRIFQHDLNQPIRDLADSSQDGIVASLVFHYIQDWNTLFRECHRLLRPEGWMLFSTHHPFGEYQRLCLETYFKCESVMDDWGVFGKVQFFRRSLTETMKSLKDAGFVIDTFLEPLPTDEIRQVDENLFDRLNRFPDFLILKVNAKPKGNPWNEKV